MIRRANWTGASWIWTGFVALAGMAPAQSTDASCVRWTADFGSTVARSYDEADAVAFDPSGNVLVVGWIDKDTSYLTPTSAVVRKHAADGTLVWSREYGSSTFSTESAHAVASDASGNVFVGGGTGDAWLLLKYDAAGTLVWSRSAIGFGGRVNGLAMAPDGSIVAAGYASGGANGLTSDWLVAKFDASGSTLWQRLYPGSTLLYGSETAEAVAVDTAGNIVVAGHEGTGCYSFYQCRDRLLRKYDPDGELVWSRGSRGSDGTDDAYFAVALDAGGDIVVAGTSGGQTNGSMWNARSLLERVSPNGTLRWTGWTSAAASVSRMGLGIGKGGNCTLAAGGGLVGFNSRGEQIWSESTGNVWHGAATGRHGVLLLAGYTYASDFSRDWHVELRPDASDCPSLVEAPGLEVVLIPNPVSNDSLAVDLGSLRRYASVSVRVFDLGGHPLYREEWTAFNVGDGRIQLTGLLRLAPGVYFMKVVATPESGPPVVFNTARLVIAR